MHALDAQDTANALRRKLGNVRCWPDFLADCIRGLTSFHGLVLMPLCYTPDRARRPAYALRDVIAFIEQASTVSPPPANPGALRPFRVELETAALKLPPRMRTGQKVPETAPR